MKQFEMNRDSSAIRRVEKRIAEVELANKYAKKTTRLHQNMKTIAILDKDLNRALYHHNKYDIFNLFEKEMDKAIAEIHAKGQTIAFSELYKTTESE